MRVWLVAAAARRVAEQKGMSRVGARKVEDSSLVLELVDEPADPHRCRALPRARDLAPLWRPRRASPPTSRPPAPPRGSSALRRAVEEDPCWEAPLRRPRRASLPTSRPAHPHRRQGQAPRLSAVPSTKIRAGSLAQVSLASPLPLGLGFSRFLGPGLAAPPAPRSQFSAACFPLQGYGVMRLERRPLGPRPSHLQASTAHRFFHDVLGVSKNASQADINKAYYGFFRNIFRDREFEVALEISFMEAVQGCTKTINFQTSVTCETCGGAGAPAGSKPETCVICRGSGFMFMQTGPFRMQSTCIKCGGSGKTVKSSACNNEFTISTILLVVKAQGGAAASQQAKDRTPERY
ncbi:chaperone protein DnaJ-like [Panicum miliaceum]|uniref:Chaperone protein DnaJ-like n=1 Tax=Panicum miliaceum TaxID=4540 RepID=A0A3L6TGZ0_PANMI|nr:chaperone protein DnaJ-like [Panicum miliaceum]